MAKTLATGGVHLMASVWPLVDATAEHYKHMAAEEMLVRNVSGQPFVSPFAPCFQPPHTQYNCSQAILDPFSNAARAYFFEKLKAGYVDNGVDVLWLDASEPQGSVPGQFYYAAGRDLSVGMAYPREIARAVHGGMLGLGKAPLSLVRSAWAGSQALGAALWSGDIESTWGELALQIRAAQSVALSGIHLWTTDIGGFRNGDATSEDFKELLVRWFQFGSMCPLFRLHGARLPNEPDSQCGNSAGPNEPWAFGPDAYARIASTMRLRESLRPYIDALLADAAKTGEPLLRPMAYVCSADAECLSKAADAQFMLGPDLLVAPVTASRAREWSVYLPAGDSWQHAFSGQVFDGGAWVRVPTTLDDFPLFHRGGSTVSPFLLQATALNREA